MEHAIKWIADIASILTCLFVIIGYAKWQCGRHHRAKRLEEYLRQEKLKGADEGKRSLLNIIRYVGLTQDEIIQASFDNPKIARRVTEDERGFAHDLLFEYQGKTSENR